MRLLGSKLRRRRNLQILDFYILVTVMPLPTFSREINDIIFSHCATSPVAQHNQTAVACRATNVLWRRMHRQTVLVLLNRMIMNLIEDAGANFVIRNVAFPLQDVVDVI